MRGGIPIRGLIALPYVLLVLISGSIIAWVGFRNAEIAVTDVALALRAEVGAHVADLIAAPLGQATRRLREASERVAALDDPRSRPASDIQADFLLTLRHAPSVSSLYLGNPDGGLVGAGHDGRGQDFYVTETVGGAAGRFLRLPITQDGLGRGAPTADLPGFDARTRPWYLLARDATGPVFGFAYPLFSGDGLAVSVSAPVPGHPGWVIGADIFLSQISDVLARAATEASQVIWLQDREGRLIATSDASAVLQPGTAAGPARILTVADSPNPAIAAAGQEAAALGLDCTSFEVMVDGRLHDVAMQALPRALGPDWCVVVMAQHDAFRAPITAANQQTAGLIILALVATILMALVISARVSRPLRQLTSAANAIAQGQMNKPPALAGVTEIGQLSRALTRMTEQLTEAVALRDRQVEALRLAETRLENERRRLDNILWGTDAATWEWTLRDDVIMGNPRLWAMLGREAEERPTLTLEEFESWVYPNDLGPARKALARHLDGDADSYAAEFRMRRPDGDYVWVLSRGKVTARDEAGRPLAMSGTYLDVTAQRLAEQELERAKLDAERANAAKSEFLAAMSHDLRTPLNAVMGFSDLMRQEAFGPLGHDRYREYADHIHRSGALLVSLINDVLDLSKVEAGKYDLVEEEVAIDQLIADALQQIAPMAGIARVTTRPDCDAGLPRLYGDSRVLIQLLNNLLSNAVKFTPAGGTIIARAARRDDGGIRISVEDTGIGMDEAGVEKALRPFEQADSRISRRHEGTGLGLYLCTRFMALMGGTLGIDSTPGQGTRVHLDFPPERSAGLTERR